MATLKGKLIQMTKRNRDGSYKRQHQRLNQMIRIGNRLHDLGYRLQDPHGLRGKHIEVLLKDWKSRNLTPGTMKNYLASLRWWAEKIGKPGLLPRDNSKLGIAKRELICAKSKAAELTPMQISKLPEVGMQISVQLEREFGLRAEESQKFQPGYGVDLEKRLIRLKASWCKGGRYREVPIETDRQQAVAKLALDYAPSGSLIPPERSYSEHEKKFERACRYLGIQRHGLRHQYAHDQFDRVAGFAAPVAGGPQYRTLDEERQATFTIAAAVVSQRLGHGEDRPDITRIYLG